jgi:pyruvate/2-oxoglutarate/acetoin dehydrogenase E1 component
MPVITYREAVAQALREALDEDPRAFLVGEDIGPYGGSFAVTKGFWEEYGERRIKDSPLSESAIVGAGVGAAMAGLRPIVELMTINFSLLAMDQIVNHAAKIRYMSGGQFSIPLILRTVTGAGAAVAATHSQSFEGWYASVPGLQVVVPSTPRDALGLFRSCRDLQDPVMYVEHILLYSSRGDVPEDGYKIPLGQAEVKREGKDITIVSYSRMVQVSLRAAEELAQEGIEAEVVDLRTLRPLDAETVVASVKKTHNALVVEETHKLGGFAGEVVSQIQEEAFDFLDSPVGRVAGEEVPVPYSMTLEPLAIPDAPRVAKAARQLLGR